MQYHLLGKDFHFQNSMRIGQEVNSLTYIISKAKHFSNVAKQNYHQRLVNIAMGTINVSFRGHRKENIHSQGIGTKTTNKHRELGIKQSMNIVFEGNYSRKEC